MHVRQATASDLPDLWPILTGQFTSSAQPVPANDLRLAFWKESPWKLFVAEREGQVVGCCMVSVNGQSYIESENLSFDAESEMDFPVGWLRLAAVKPGQEGDGIGTAVAKYALDYAERQWGVVYAIAWVKDIGKNSSGMLERLGFEEIGYVENPWWDDEVCEGCDAPPCTCDGALYRHRFE